MRSLLRSSPFPPEEEAARTTTGLSQKRPLVRTGRACAADRRSSGWNYMWGKRWLTESERMVQLGRPNVAQKEGKDGSNGSTIETGRSESIRRLLS